MEQTLAVMMMMIGIVVAGVRLIHAAWLDVNITFLECRTHVFVFDMEVFFLFTIRHCVFFLNHGCDFSSFWVLLIVFF